MKTKKIKMLTIFLLLLPLCFVLLGAGCEDDDGILELQIGDENPVILKEVSGVEFKFCLLNEQGEPATIFNEGENFTFLFSVTNKSGRKLYLDNSFLDNSFCNVYTTKGKEIGKPYEFVSMFNIGQAALPLDVNDTYIINVPWKDNRESWSTLYYSFKGLSKDLLPQGKYFTEFSHQFNLSSIKTDLLNFSISVH
jgi:hypothetical protein